jgi:NADP-dependent aldehyde dehydrogenase
MLHPSILAGYRTNVEHRAATAGISVVKSGAAADDRQTQAVPVLFETDAETWTANPALADEIFGPSAVLVRSKSKEDLLRIAKGWHGTLTASIFGTPEDLASHHELIAILEQKAGRLLFNGFPTGVEVSPAMHHGGPYPATGDPKFTSVGTAAIYRFLRPICYQSFPETALPSELRNENPRGLWRLINGSWTKDDVSATR